MCQHSYLPVALDPSEADFVARRVGANGDYLTMGEYIRDLIRRDRDEAKQRYLERDCNEWWQARELSAHSRKK